MSALRDVIHEALGQVETDVLVTVEHVDSMADELAEALVGKVIVREVLEARLRNERDMQIINQRHHYDGHRADPEVWEKALEAVRSLP